MTMRLVAAYGGGLQAAASLATLAGRLDAELVTVTLDVGQAADLEQLRDEARGVGAARAHVVDARRELAAEIIRPALMAGAFQADPLVTAVTRPAIARHLAGVARMEGTTAVAHAATGADRVRLERLLADLAPELAVHAAVVLERDEAEPAHVDQNLWGRAVTVGQPADLWIVPPARTFTRTSEPQTSATEPAIVEIAIERGVPVAVNGVPLDIDELLEVVDTIAGDHGVGRFDRAADGSRAIVEAPAAVVLSTAIAELAAARFDRQLLALHNQAGRAYADVIDDGRWNTPARAALDAFAAAAADQLTGAVRLLLQRGACRVVGRRTDAPLAHRSSAYGSQPSGAGLQPSA